MKDKNLLINNTKICKEWSTKNQIGPENYTCGSHKLPLLIVKYTNKNIEETLKEFIKNV